MKTKEAAKREAEYILLVEDSPTQALQLQHILEQHNYHAAVTTNGREALATMRPHKPLLVISDILMPEMDGYHLCRQIKTDEQLADIPVILLTSLSDPKDVIRGLECGADSFIMKPYDEQYLLSRIRYILANRRLRREENAQLGIEIVFAGQTYFITSDRLQILNLLLSTYETAVQQNRELRTARDTLQKLNEHLQQRTAELAKANEQLRTEIAERKRTEEKLTSVNENLRRYAVELEAANKELDAFSYSISHDLRTPLRAVNGFASILLEDYATHLPPDAQRHLQYVKDGGLKLGQLIDDLLTFSRLSRQPLKRQPIILTSLVRQVLEELHDEQEGRQVEMTIGDLPPCYGDSALLKQVITNFLTNALKFTRQREVAHIEIGCQQTDGETTYFVKDNGVGFDMQYTHKLFGVFQRLHSAKAFEGTGAGLAIVQRIIHRHGGQVWAEAAVNHGATFYFTLGGSAAA